MSANDPLGKLTQQILDSLPEGGDELKRYLHTALVSGLRRLDLVTREEFEVQNQLLQRSREKLDALERQVAAMEQQLLK